MKHPSRTLLHGLRLFLLGTAVLLGLCSCGGTSTEYGVGQPIPQIETPRGMSVEEADL